MATRFAVHQPCCDGTAVIAILTIANLVDERVPVFPVAHDKPPTALLEAIADARATGLSRIVFFDVAPSDVVIAAARDAGVFLEVLDHHTSEKERLTLAAAQWPEAVSFTFGEGLQCGAVLALQWAQSRTSCLLPIREDVLNAIAVADTTGVRSPVSYALFAASVPDMVTALTATPEQYDDIVKAGTELQTAATERAARLLDRGSATTLCGFGVWLVLSDDTRDVMLTNDAAGLLWDRPAPPPPYFMLLITTAAGSSAFLRVKKGAGSCLALVEAVKASCAGFTGGGQDYAAGIQGSSESWRRLGVALP